LRGVKLLTAAVLATEIGNFDRFASAPELMAYLGLVPSESSSGQSQRRGSITRSGNTFVRRALVEAAWAYRHRPGITQKLRLRQHGISDQVRKTAWKAQLHLSARFRSMTARGKNKQQVVTAIARKLAGFVWAIAREPNLLAA
jgi:transposase